MERSFQGENGNKPCFFISWWSQVFVTVSERWLARVMEIWFSSNIILLSFPCVLIILLPGDSLLLHQQLVSLHVVKQFYSIAFVCVCTYVSWVHVQVCVLEYETSFLPEPGAHWCVSPASPSHYPASVSQHWTSRCTLSHLAFSHGLWRLNSGPYACTMNTL